MTLAIAIPLAGCTSTEHAAQRERLDAARQRAAFVSTRVTVANPHVSAAALATIRSRTGTALVATIRNAGHRAVTDLPISVGYTTSVGASVYLNAGTNLTYFEAHLPAIRAGHELTWVFTTGTKLPQGAHVFARVGLKPAAPALLTEMGVHIGLGYTDTAGGHSLAVRLQNSSGVPQYELQVYAYGRQDGRYVAAGDATVDELDPGASQRLRLTLLGSPTTQLHVVAVPTILQ